jgi:hypothetical protein
MALHTAVVTVRKCRRKCDVICPFTIKHTPTSWLPLTMAIGLGETRVSILLPRRLSVSASRNLIDVETPANIAQRRKKGEGGLRYSVWPARVDYTTPGPPPTFSPMMQRSQHFSYKNQWRTLKHRLWHRTVELDRHCTGIEDSMDL